MKEKVKIRELKKMLERVVWDYDINPDDVVDIYFNEKKSNSLNKTMLQAKLLNTYSWHKLLKVLGDDAFDLMRDEVIRQIFPRSYREQLYNAKRILSE